VSTAHFRAGVILVVRRSDGQVLSFERSDHPATWQLPQGGIDAGETPEQAAWRELAEETGLDPDTVRLVGQYDGWTFYEYPDDIKGGRFADRIGQAHRWFFFEVVDDAVTPVPDGHEFVDWRWTDVATLVGEVAEFRRAGYAQVLQAGVAGREPT
jgi:putative (di)nucleoside polyphosphate hydrolase